MDTVTLTRADLEAITRNAWDVVGKYYRPEDVARFVDKWWPKMPDPKPATGRAPSPPASWMKP